MNHIRKRFQKLNEMPVYIWLDQQQASVYINGKNPEYIKCKQNYITQHP